MADNVTADVRSRMMSGIRSVNTRPEMAVRRALHARGFRFRLHDRSLPGTPDIVFPGRKAVIQVHGCFWHGHDCHLFRWPASRPEFWRAKIAHNRAVDERSARALEALGWRQGVVWECALKGRTRLSIDAVAGQCDAWLRGNGARLEVRGS